MMNSHWKFLGHDHWRLHLPGAVLDVANLGPDQWGWTVCQNDCLMEAGVASSRQAAMDAVLQVSRPSQHSGSFNHDVGVWATQGHYQPISRNTVTHGTEASRSERPSEHFCVANLVITGYDLKIVASDFV